MCYETSYIRCDLNIISLGFVQNHNDFNQNMAKVAFLRQTIWMAKNSTVFKKGAWRVYIWTPVSLVISRKALRYKVKLYFKLKIRLQKISLPFLRPTYDQQTCMINVDINACKIKWGYPSLADSCILKKKQNLSWL